VLATIAAVLVAAFVGTAKLPTSGGKGHFERPNVLLLSIDTLRADHLGCYGYERNTSPRLDELARRSVRFEEAWAPAPWTLPSHAGLLTGVHPRDLGIEHQKSRIPDSAPRLAAALAQEGYQTAAFVDSLPLDFVGAERGFGKGFQEYWHLSAEKAFEFVYDMGRTADRAVQWLEDGDRRKPFFLFLHTKSVHNLPSPRQSPRPERFPYDKPEPYQLRFVSPEALRLVWSDPILGEGIEYLNGVNERVAAGLMRPDDLPRERLETLVGLYDAGIFYTDEHFGRVLDALERTGLARNTVVIVTADHGESFHERELLLHKEVARATLHVPLLVHLPWDPHGRSVAARVSLLDVMPTVLALAGAVQPKGLAGTNLPLYGSVPEEARPLFSYYHFQPNYYYEGYALQEGRFALLQERLGIDAPFQTRLYDLVADPTQRRPTSNHPAVYAAMTQRLQEWQARAPQTNGGQVTLDAKTADRLRALGYAVDGP
jgi:arylsulfatase